MPARPYYYNFFLRTTVVNERAVVVSAHPLSLHLLAAPPVRRETWFQVAELVCPLPYPSGVIGAGSPSYSPSPPRSRAASTTSGTPASSSRSLSRPIHSKKQKQNGGNQTHHHQPPPPSADFKRITADAKRCQLSGEFAIWRFPPQTREGGTPPPSDDVPRSTQAKKTTARNTAEQQEKQ